MYKLIVFLALFFTNGYALSMKGILERELCSSVYDHITEKLQSAQVIEYPFPHIVVENILPDDLYVMASSQWPCDSAFIGHGNGNHFILPVTGGVAEKSRLDHDQKIFWRVFGEVIVNRYIKPRIAAMLIPYLPMKAGLENYDISKFDLTQDIASFRQDNIAFDQGPYNTNIHIDQRNILAAMLIYMPVDNDHQELGTQFFEGPPAGCNDVYNSNSSFSSLVKIVPYKPNTLVAFMQTPISWHAYSQKGDTDYRRRFYHAPIFLSPEFMRTHIPDYHRTYIDDYFFDGRYLNSSNWVNIWGSDE